MKMHRRTETGNPLNSQQKHVMRLIEQDCDSDGWAMVNERLFGLLSKNMPVELVTFERLRNGGRARLTDEGKNVLNAMKWL